MNKNAYLIELSESDCVQLGKVDFDEQGDEQRVFSAIWTLESEVNNGGFEQFIENQDPNIVSFTPTALETIGARACAAITTSALSLVRNLGSSEAADQLEELDAKFYEYPDNLTDLLFAYVSAHPEVFGEIPDGA